MAGMGEAFEVLGEASADEAAHQAQLGAAGQGWEAGGDEGQAPAAAVAVSVAGDSEEYAEENFDGAEDEEQAAEASHDGEQGGGAQTREETAERDGGDGDGEAHGHGALESGGAPATADVGDAAGGVEEGADDAPGQGGQAGVEEDDAATAPDQGDEEEGKQQHAAAVKIQSRARGVAVRRRRAADAGAAVRGEGVAAAGVALEGPAEATGAPDVGEASERKESAEGLAEEAGTVVANVAEREAEPESIGTGVAGVGGSEGSPVLGAALDEAGADDSVQQGQVSSAGEDREAADSMPASELVTDDRIPPVEASRGADEVYSDDDAKPATPPLSEAAPEPEAKQGDGAGVESVPEQDDLDESIGSSAGAADLLP